MSGIKSANTRPEMIIRRGLHARGYRYRLHVRSLPGTPDMVFPARRAVIFVHGCFWHGHDCSLFKLPATNSAFWEAKIAANQSRDVAAASALTQAGWRVLNVWECAVRGRYRQPLVVVLDQVARWLVDDGVAMDLSEDQLGSTRRS